MRTKLVGAFIFVCLIFSGCAGKRVELYPSLDDPIYLQKMEFIDQYFYFITPVEAEEFKLLTTAVSFDKFNEEFWKKRDTNPLTPENEFKDIIDDRIRDIENEIYATDFDIPGTRFDASGGLRGDLAHVYLLYGPPTLKEKLEGGRNYDDLMVWYYFDYRGQALFRFLFYSDFGSYRLFREHPPIITMEYLFDPLVSPLEAISNRPVPTQNDLIELWSELSFNDIGWMFRSALLEFSYYQDVSVEDALAVPEPSALTAARSKPTILGQPGDLTEREFVYSSYSSFIPAIFRLVFDTNTGEYTPYILLKFGDLDWEIKSQDEGNSILFLRISFQNIVTKDVREFEADILLGPNKDVMNKNNMTAKEFIEKNKDSFFPVLLTNLINNVGPPSVNLANLMSSLTPGTYIVNASLRHQVTKKSAGGWREELVIK